MRRVNLVKNEMSLLYSILNIGGGEKGLTLKEVNDLKPLMEKVCKNAEFFMQNENEMVRFNDSELVMKESEWSMIKRKIEGMSGIANYEIGKKISDLLEKFKELPEVHEEKA